MNILITGATSGIGKELALSYARNQHKVFAIGRNQAVMNELKTYNISTIIADITSLDDLSRAQNEIISLVSCIDLMILSAGSCEYIDTFNFSQKPFKEIMNINFFGMVNCLEYFLPLLRQSKSPHLVGISSIAYYLPLSRAEAYGASKAAVNYLLESLAIDLAEENICVTVVNPGFVETPLTQKNDFPMPFILTLKEAGAIIIDGIEARKTEISFPKKLTIPIKILSLLPRFLWRKIGLIFRK
jgi:short-subunit dehydrogenase